MFKLLQKIGKALMTPVAVLPVAALLLRFGFGDIPFIHGTVAAVMKAAGESIFAHLDLLFAVGIAYGLSKDKNGAAALAGAVALLVLQAVYTTIDKDVNPGIFSGLIAGVVSGLLYNRYHTMALPDYLGFFSGRRFVPIVAALAMIVAGLAIGAFWGYAQAALDRFSHTIASTGALGTFAYGTLNRALIPLGLHHILNSVFWFQLGEYHYLKEGVETVANGDLHRFFAGDKHAGIYMAGFYVPMIFGLPAMALALWLKTSPRYRKKAGALLFSAALASMLTGVTEPMEFLFLFSAPILFAMHALLTGLALAAAQLLDIHAGFGFSAGLIDYLINYPLGQRVWILLPLGVLFALFYFFGTLLLIRLFKLKVMESELGDEAQEAYGESGDIDAFITALGGKENILSSDACITRLRMELRDSSKVDETALKRLGATGVIKPDSRSAQVVLGAKAQTVSDAIRAKLSPSS